MTVKFHVSIETFERLYRGEPLSDAGPASCGAPWDVHEAQPSAMELKVLSGIYGDVLDTGAHVGNTSIYLASQGYMVTGLDGSATAIDLAREPAVEAGVTLTFGVADATKLGPLGG
jgi:2-polyprenyl-3-methyl-5-hydroxy-6-metoxy-1,4-benzoquinol methylase